MTGSAARVRWKTPKKFASNLGPEVALVGVLDRRRVRVPRVVDEHVHAPEPRDGGGHRAARVAFAGDVERDGESSVLVGRDEPCERARIAGRGDEAGAGGQHGLRDRAPEPP